MNLKKAVQAMAVKDLRESRDDLVILDALPMREAIELLTEGLAGLDIDDDARATLVEALSAPAERDLVAESMSSLIASLESLDGISEKAMESVLAVIKEAGTKLAIDVKLPEATEAEDGAEESKDEGDDAHTEESEEDEGAEESEDEGSEESEESDDVKPDVTEGVDALNMVRAQRALDHALRDGNLPDPVEQDVRTTLESEIDQDGSMTAEAVVERVAELVAQSKRAAESWSGEPIEGHKETSNDDKDEGARESSDDDPRKKAEALFIG